MSITEQTKLVWVAPYLYLFIQYFIQFVTTRITVTWQIEQQHAGPVSPQEAKRRSMGTGLVCFPSPHGDFSIGTRPWTKLITRGGVW